MTSEELEISLRTEFENYLKDTLASVRKDVSDFQQNFETEFAKHRSQMDEAIKTLASRFESGPELDKGFAEAVVEHLRLARDEGAQITANAFGEAEKLKQAEAEVQTAPAKYDLIRDAVSDISSQTTQAAILGSLVEHAADFAPRGAFFIVKNDQFIGWRSFGEGSPDNETSLQTLSFPLSQETVLSRSVLSLKTAESADGHETDDKVFLEPLEYIRPDRMFAIPLVARGRGVAVLYADYGSNGVELNREALETLVRVAGLTVELRAAAQQASSVAQDAVPAAPVVAETVAVKESVDEEYSHPAEAPAYQPEPTAFEPVSYTSSSVSSSSYEYEAPAVPEVKVEEFVAAEPAVEYTEPYQSFETTPSVETSTWQQPDAAPAFETADQPEITSFSYEEPAVTENAETFEAPTTDSFELERTSEAVEVIEEVEEPAVAYNDEPVAVETASFEAPAFDTTSDASYSTVSEPEYAPAVAVETAPVSNGHIAETVTATPSVDTTASTNRSRFGDRSIDLPIDVPEEDRKMHNNARRFARLLVSEIKLYNEQKVVEGRESGDLYDRLKEAIDRSREMYEKRVEPSVAAKFDYFHYEILNDLAAGESAKLGNNYPGAVVQN